MSPFVLVYFLLVGTLSPQLSEAARHRVVDSVERAEAGCPRKVRRDLKTQCVAVVKDGPDGDYQDDQVVPGTCCDAYDGCEKELAGYMNAKVGLPVQLKYYFHVCGVQKADIASDNSVADDTRICQCAPHPEFVIDMASVAQRCSTHPDFDKVQGMATVVANIEQARSQCGAKDDAGAGNDDSPLPLPIPTDDNVSPAPPPPVLQREEEVVVPSPPEGCGDVYWYVHADKSAPSVKDRSKDRCKLSSNHRFTQTACCYSYCTADVAWDAAAKQCKGSKGPAPRQCCGIA